MTCEEKVRALLIADDALTAVLPAERILVPGDWQSLSMPYLIHQPVVGRVTHTHSEGLVPLREWDFYEVSVYALTHSQARQIADLVVTALDNYSDDDVDRIALANTPRPEPFDDDRKIARVSLDFEIAGALT